MIDCKETLKRFYDYLDRELPELESREVEEHLSQCRHCFDRMEFEKLFTAYVRRDGQIKVDTQALKGRLLQQIRALEGPRSPSSEELFPGEEKAGKIRARVPTWSYLLVAVSLALLALSVWMAWRH